jgi:hypothetical protein
MLRFETKNSVYDVQMAGNEFVVTKIGEKNHSPFNEVGKPRRSFAMSLQVGARAMFDGWSTSLVQKIYGSAHDAPETKNEE